MTTRFRSLLVVTLALAPSLAAAQTRASLSRTPDGHPDLQGVYDVATLTPLERAAAQPLVLTDEEAGRLETAVANRKFRAGLPSRGDRNAPPTGGDGSTGAAGNVGGYNSFWIDNGTRYVTVDGRKLFLGSSGTGAPVDGADPTEGGRGRGRGRGGL